MSVKAFKEILKDQILDRLSEFGYTTIGENYQKTGACFNDWFIETFTDFDGFYKPYMEDFPESQDNGVDFVLWDEKGKRVIIGQSKAKGLSSNTQSNHPRDEIVSFFNLHKEIMQNEWLLNASSQTKEMLGEYKKWVVGGWDIKYIFVTTSKNPGNINIDSEELVFSSTRGTKTKGTLEKEIWDIHKLNSYYLDAKAQEDSIPEKVIFPVLTGKYFQKRKPNNLESVGSTFVGSVSGGVLANLYDEHKSRLFSHNIRQFLGRRKNIKVVETAKTNPSSFFYFNNGITAICTNFSLNEKKNDKDKIISADINADNFQIINGAQTVGSILDARRDDANLKDLEVLIRIIKTSDRKTAKGFNREIVTYNNTQQKVDTWDFISNDDIQLYLAKELKNLNVQLGEKYTYERKRIMAGSPGAKKVKPEHLAKLIYSFTFEDFIPGIPYGEGKTTLINKKEDSESGLYDEVFKTDQNEWTKKQLNETKLAIQLWFLLDKYIRNLDREDPNKATSGVKYIIISLLRIIIDEKQLSITKLLSNKSEFTNFFNQYIEKILSFTSVQMENYASGKPISNIVRNYSRDKDEYDRLKRLIFTLV